jgi:hypothetical protein
MYFLDLVYAGILIGLTIRIILIVKKRIQYIFWYKTIDIPWYDVLDILILCFSYVCLGYWIWIFLVNHTVDLRSTKQSNFDKYSKLSVDMINYKLFVSITTILICLRLFRIFTEKLPSFGALFDTIQVALKDLLKIGMSLLIIFIGFVYAAHFILGTNNSDFATFFNTFLQLFYLIFGDGNKITSEGYQGMKVAADIFFIIFVICFVSMFLKILMAIVIVRYKYLRSKVQLDNETSARIIQAKSKEFNQKLLNLLCCKKRVSTGVHQRMERESNKRTQIAFWQNIFLNYREIKDLNKLQTKEERQIDHDAMKKQILKEREIRKNDRIKAYSASNFDKHKLNFKKMIVHLIYISLFLAIIMMQLKVDLQYDQNKVLDWIIDQYFFLGKLFLANILFGNICSS